MSLMIGSAQAQLTLDVSQFTGAAGQAMSSMSKLEGAGGNVFNKAGKGVDAFGSKVRGLSSEINTVGIAMVGLGVTITAAIGGAIKTSISFNSAMANVNSIAQLSTEQIADLSDEVLKLATATGQGPQILAEGLYDIYSSGFQGAEGLIVLEVAANAANAGLTTTAVSAKAVTAVLNAYGLEATDAAHVSDVLFQTVNDGVLTFEQLATNMGNTLPLGNALGVTIEELAAAYAQMTLNGISATQAETQISALMRAAINPTEGMTAAIKAYGYESASALIAAEGLPGFLKFLGETSGGSSEALFDLLGTSEAVNAALVLGKNDVADYTAELERMNGASEGTGATQKALAKQMESTGFQLQRLKANFQVLLITIGTFFEPAIRTAANAIEKLIQTFLGLPSGVQKAIAILTAITGAVALVGGAMLLALPQILQFRTAMTALGGLKGIISLIGGGMGFGALIPIVLGATAVIGGLTLAYAGNYFGFRDFVDNILSYGKPVIDFFKDLKDGWDDVTSIFGGGSAEDVAGPTTALGAMQNALGAGGGVSKGITLTVKNASKFTKAIGAADYALGRLAKNDNAPKFLRDFASAAQSALPQIQNFGLFLGAIWSGSPRQAMEFIDQMPQSFQNIAKAIAPAIMGVGELFRSFRIGGLEGFAEQLPKTLQSIGQSITDLFHVFSGGLSLKDWTLDVGIPTLTGWITTGASNVWEFVKSAAGWVGGVIGDIGAWTLEVGVPTVFGWITNVASNVWSWLKIAAGWTGNVLGNIGAWTLEVGAPTVFGWITNVAGNVWSYLKIAGGWVGNVVGDIGAWTLEVGAPTVFGWIKNIASNVWAWLQIAAGWAGKIIGKIDAWTLEVAAPAVTSVLGDIGSAVDTAVQGAYSDYVAGGGFTTLPDVEAKVDNVNVDASGATITETGGGQTWEAKGQTYGTVVGNKIIEGFNTGIGFLSGGGGGGEGGGGGASLWGSIDAFASTMSGALQGAMDSVINELESPGAGTQALGNVLQVAFIQPFIDTGNNIAKIGPLMAEGAGNLIQPILEIPDLLDGLGDKVSGAMDAITAPFETAWDGAIAAYRRFREIVFGEISSNTDEGTYANAGGTNDPTKPGLGSGAGGSMTDSSGKQTPVSFLPETGSGPGTMVPPLNTAAFDASVAAFTAKLQAILTAVNATFVTAIPANITAGMTTSTAAITTNSAIWGVTFGTGMQSILTLVNAVFGIAIPMNVNLGMVTASTAVTTNMAIMGASYGAGAQAILTTTSAVFGTAIPAVVNNGMSAASGSVRTQANSWPGIVNGIAGSMGSAGYNAGAAAGFGVANGMNAALGSIQAAANAIAAIVANTIALKLLIASPSKVTTRLGEQVGEGFALGIASKKSDVERASEELSDAAERAFSRNRVQTPGGGSAGGGGIGGGTDTPGTGGATESKWSDLIANGLDVAMTDALKNSGLGTDMSVGTLFNEADFMARRKAMGDAYANNIADLFEGRTWLNSTDALINENKFLEEYGSPVGPNDDITGKPPVIIDPTKPPKGGVIVIPGTPGFGQVMPKGQLPNRPNNGSNRVQTQTVVNNYTTDARSTVTQQMASPELIRVMDGAGKGRSAHGALSNIGTKRTLAHGARTVPGRD